MSAETSLGASNVRARSRAGVPRRAQVSRTAKAAMLLFARAGAVVGVVFYLQGRGSADAREVGLVAVTIFWTVVAVTLIFTVDGVVRSRRGRSDTGSEPRL